MPGFGCKASAELEATDVMADGRTMKFVEPSTSEVPFQPLNFNSTSHVFNTPQSFSVPVMITSEQAARQVTESRFRISDMVTFRSKPKT
jgi:hypothetical protein